LQLLWPPYGIGQTIIFLNPLSRVVDAVQATSAKFLRSSLIVMKCLKQLLSLIKLPVLYDVSHILEAV